jgi:hypothetical protein
MVRPISGSTEKGDKYRIVGGKSYLKSGNYYELIFYRIADRLSEGWKIPAENLSIDKLEHKLKGPLPLYEDKPPYGREFLLELGKKPTWQDRLSEDSLIF